MTNGSLFKFDSKNIFFQGPAVTPVGGHGVARIRNGNHACNFRNIVSGQSFGVSVAVVPFVMVMRCNA